MSAERNFTEQDYELLSAYLDGALTSDERATLETRLQTDDGLRQELEGLRQTVKLIGSVAEMKAPRNFTLTREMVGLRQTRWLIFPTSAAFSGVLAAAATILIVIGAGMFLFQNQSSNTAAPAAVQSTQLGQEEAAPGIAVIPTQTAPTTSEKTAETAEQETADLFESEVSVTAPPMDNLRITQDVLTLEASSSEIAGDTFAIEPESMDMQIESPPAASEISGYMSVTATIEDLTIQTTLPYALPMGATFSPQATMVPPVQAPVTDGAAQVGGNSPADDTQTGSAAEEAGLADQANMAIAPTEAASATLNRESLTTPTPEMPASSAMMAIDTETPLPTATPSATLTPTTQATATAIPPTPTSLPAQEPAERTGDSVTTNANDFAPLILLAGVVLLAIAIITTVVRRRG